MRALFASLSLLIVAGVQAEEDPDVLYQVSTVDAVLSGVYDSLAKVGEVAEHGDLGLGTFDALDGELILLDGVVYQAASDGSVNVMPSSSGTPFMAVTHFESDRFLDAPAPLDLRAFEQWLEAALPSRNILYAVRADALFANMRVRSVPRQHKPYPPLVDAARRQAVFARTDISGTLIGFWCPPFVKGINVPGLHLHFLSADRRFGGHVLDFRMEEGKVRLDDTEGWEVRLPTLPAYLDADLTGDRSTELQKVERGTADSPASVR
jgi:acetolactate decarboxylase